MGDPAARDVLVIGDSHIQQIVARYAHAYPAGQGVTFVSQGGCLPVPGVGRREAAASCDRWVEEAYRFAETAGYQRVVIGSMWIGYFDREPGEPVGVLCFVSGSRCITSFDRDRYLALIDQAFDRLGARMALLRRKGVDVTIIGPFPHEPEADPYSLYRIAFSGGPVRAAPIVRTRFEAEAAFARAHVERAAKIAGVRLIDPVSALCPDATCPVQQGDVPLYKDATHYRAAAVSDPRFAFLDPWINPSPTRQPSNAVWRPSE